ncbi:alpha/beta hydrolase [Streptomyces sp. NPDC004752]
MADPFEQQSPTPLPDTPRQFYVGGRYHGEPGNRVMAGQMYVEEWQPKAPRQPFPLVLVQGGAQTATNWMTTPDGRPGWKDIFLSHGFPVYLIDQPARGRSVWHDGINGTQIRLTAETVEKMFTATSRLGHWPHAHQHTQWPGTGRMGDPSFDAFYATQVPYLADFAETENVFRDAAANLLDQIGPAVVVTHSQAGSSGWVLADARPGLVRAIVAVEPYGPPFAPAGAGFQRVDAMLENAPRGNADWGITHTPLTYHPPVTDPAELRTTWEAQTRGHHGAGSQPPAALPKLTYLADVPTLVLTGEASYHSDFDHLTVDYLRAAGVPVTAWQLADHGIHGNGHMMMCEENNAEIANLITKWLSDTVTGAAA